MSGETWRIRNKYTANSDIEIQKQRKTEKKKKNRDEKQEKQTQKQRRKQWGEKSYRERSDQEGQTP